MDFEEYAKNSARMGEAARWCSGLADLIKDCQAGIPGLAPSQAKRIDGHFEHISRLLGYEVVRK